MDSFDPLGLIPVKSEFFVGKIIPVGVEWFAITKGQIDLIEVLRQILNYTGPAAVDIITWTVGSDTIKSLDGLIKSGKIKKIRLVIDRSYGARNESYRAELCQAVGDKNIRVTSCHAKIMTICNSSHSVVITGSMNLNRNKRFETIQILYNKAILCTIKSFVDGWFETGSDASVFGNWDINKREFDKFGQESRSSNVNNARLMEILKESKAMAL